MKYKLIVPAITIVIASASLYVAGSTYAQFQKGHSSTIIQRIAQKFGLKESDIQAVFDEEKAERQAEMQSKFEERLDQAVQDDKITEDQKNLILAKHKELEANRASESDMKDLTPDQRKEAMETQRQSVENWAKQNGIDPQYLFGGFGMRGKRPEKIG
ncbi:hypothetical protein COT62_02315 [Candidatus Roizmanbacteria bacterium CG09_land_8_20_14_0_10_41_9]|uniref:Uncharacterized protein n=1 Tax=Candidatus Roizmanbacteria bacterium CG09_land_8_20_14_0_10_41_9 TaxID=1974850 RepID=A0A2H0WSP8_9BACT|nr:MAG: hypothetical protein COT62_02315 [Candidatus Roizmanbacteria bacterium CG09_land_8_20_14_0_10_41_9]